MLLHPPTYDHLLSSEQSYSYSTTHCFLLSTRQNDLLTTTRQFKKPPKCISEQSMKIFVVIFQTTRKYLIKDLRGSHVIWMSYLMWFWLSNENLTGSHVELHIFNNSFSLASASAHHIVNTVFGIQCSIRMTQQSVGTRYHWISLNLTLRITQPYFASESQ